MFESVNMKNCGSSKVRKHKEIKGSYNIFALNVSEKFDNLNTSSESKVKLGRSGKGLVTALYLKTKARSKNTKMQGMPSEISA